jgi:hypothetical protein
MKNPYKLKYQCAETIESVSKMIKEQGDASWKLWLFEFVDAFRRQTDFTLIESPPVADVSLRMRCLLDATTEALCAEKNITSPQWCRELRVLPEPWFVSECENLKAMALVESPVYFRKRNIFVLNNFLRRA